MFFDVATKTQVSYLLFYQRDWMLWCPSGSSLQECFFYVFVKNLKIVVFKKTWFQAWKAPSFKKIQFDLVFGFVFGASG